MTRSEKLNFPTSLSFYTDDQLVFNGYMAPQITPEFTLVRTMRTGEGRLLVTLISLVSDQGT